MELPYNIINTEKLFCLELNNDISNDYNIIKSQYKYCNVDILLINRFNLYSVYIEYKKREYKIGFTSYDSYFIGKVKLIEIDKNYKNCYFIWDFRDSSKSKEYNDKQFFYIKYNQEFMNKYELDYDKKNESYRYKILSVDCDLGYDNFIKELYIVGNKKIKN